MDATQLRAKQVDKKLDDLTKTMDQLQAALPRMIAASNTNPPKVSKSKQPQSKSKPNSDAVLSRSDTQTILKKLKSIKSKILKYEQERQREKEHLAQIRNDMRTELLAIKKELMVNNLRQTPDEFRTYLTSQLLAVKQELLKIDQQQPKSQIISGNESITNPNKAVLLKVKNELLGIRKEMARKIDELNQYKAFEQNFNEYKKNLNAKLVKLKDVVKDYENELIDTKKELQRVKAENDDFQFSFSHIFSHIFPINFRYSHTQQEGEYDTEITAKYNYFATKNVKGASVPSGD